MRKNKIIAAVALIVAAASLFAVAAFGDGLTGKPVTFRPGTEDTVGNMPEEGALDQVSDYTCKYTIPETVPTREGYDFLGWELDYGPQIVTYTIQHINAITNEHILDDCIVDIEKGTVVIEDAPEITDYICLNPTLQAEINNDGMVLVFLYIYMGGPVIG